MKYRKKPIIIEAIQVPYRFSNNREDYPNWFVEANENGTIEVYRGMMTQEVKYVEIKTLEGTMLASVGDYIIKGVAGELYPCKHDIFEASYEKVEELEGKGLTPLEAINIIAYSYGYDENIKIVNKALKAFEIIKEKGVSFMEIALIVSCKSYEEYCIEMKSNRVYLTSYECMKTLKTKEEFDLLKEMLNDTK